MNSDETATRVEGSGLSGTRQSVPPRVGLGAGGLFKGDVLGRYVLIDFVGAGGMGEVFVAYDPQLDRRVALKLVHGESTLDQEARTRLLREAQAIAQVAHPNVVGVHDLGELGDRVFIAMEYIDGPNLRGFLQGRPGWAEVLKPMIGAGHGLAAAHAVGLVHRDFKPENVLIGKDGRARVVDFGLAKPPELAVTPRKGPRPEAVVTENGPTERGLLATPLTEANTVIGTPAYMAPEQHELRSIDGRADQFGFCVTLFEALYGVRPFRGDTTTQLLAAIVLRELQPVPEGSQVPDWLREVLQRGLAYEAKERYPSMEALLAELERDRRRIKTRWLVGGALAAGALISAAITSEHLRGERCHEGRDRFATVWSDRARTQVRASFRAVGLPFGERALSNLEKALDQYATQWAAGADDACAATRLQHVASEAALARRTACLDANLEDARQLVSLLEEADKELITNSAEVLESLGRPAVCATLGETGPQPWSAAGWRERRSQLARVKASFYAGHYPAGLLLARALTAELAEDGGTPERGPSSDPAARALEAEAQLFRARLEAKSGHAPEAKEAWLEAGLAGEASGAQGIAVEAWGELAAHLGDMSPKESALSPWPRLAQAALERVSPPDLLLEAKLSMNLGRLAAAEGRLADGLRWSLNALTLREHQLGPEHPDVGEAEYLVGRALHGLGRSRDAIGHFERAIAIATASRGPEHPSVGFAENGLALMLMRLGLLAQAETHYRRTEEIFEAITPDAPIALSALESRGDVKLMLDDEVGARRELDLALAKKLRLYGGEHLSVALSYLKHIDLLVAEQRPAAAVELATTVLAMHRRLMGEGHLSLSTCHSNLGAALIANGELKRARAEFEEAERLRLAHVGRADINYAISDDDFGALLLAEGRPAEAAARYVDAIKLREPALGPDSFPVANERAGLGRALFEAGDVGGARTALQAAVEALAKTEAPLSLAGARDWLARAHWRLGDFAAARQLLTLAREGYRDRGLRSAKALEALDRWAAANHL